MKASEAFANVDMEFNLVEGEFLTDIVVIARSSKLDGSSGVYLETNQDCDIVTQIGLIEAARQITTARDWEQEDGS